MDCSVNGSGSWGWDCDCNKIGIEKLCATCARICWLKSKGIWTEDLQVNTLCAQSAQAVNASANSLSTNNLCAQSANIKNLCVENLQAINSNIYRASAFYSTDATYTLSSPLAFDTIAYDPNNNLTLGPLAYTAPITGVYLATFRINSKNLVTTSGPLLGVPVAQLQLMVNLTQVARNSYSPYLSFSDEQSSDLTSQLTLNAGDVVSVSYSILGGGASGIPLPVAGTIVIEGPPSPFNQSSFSIILLTVSSTPPVIPCIPCAPVVVPCLPVVIDKCPVQSPC